jgi:hypothetical protein
MDLVLGRYDAPVGETGKETVEKDISTTVEQREYHEM